MTLPEISDRVWHLAHAARFLRDAIRELEGDINANGALPADVAGQFAHLVLVARAVEERRRDDPNPLTPEPTEAIPEP